MEGSIVEKIEVYVAVFGWKFNLKQSTRPGEERSWPGTGEWAIQDFPSLQVLFCAAHLPGSGGNAESRKRFVSDSWWWEQRELLNSRAGGAWFHLHCTEGFSKCSASHGFGSAGRGKEGLNIDFNLRQALQGRLLHIRVYFLKIPRERISVCSVFLM